MSKVLVVVPHADELAFHIGGTIARWVADGHQVFQAVLTTGARASFTLDRGALEATLRQEARRSAALLGLQDLFFWDYEDGLLHEGHVLEIRERLTALVRHLQVDTVFGFDPWSPRDYHPDQLIAGKATYWTVYFSGFPQHAPHQRDLGLQPCMVVDQYYFAYHPEGDSLEAIDIAATIEQKVQAVLAFESQMQWCADIAIAQRQRRGLPTDDIDRGNYGPVIAAQVRDEAAQRGKRHGLAYAEVLRHIADGGTVLT